MCAKYQASSSKTVTLAQKANFHQKNTKKVKEKNTLTKKLGQNSKIEKIPPLEKNSKIMCAKNQDSNLKSVPWAQKVNFCRKNTKKVKEKNTLSPLT